MATPRLNSELENEFREAVGRLFDGPVEERYRAARALGRLGVESRRSIRPRGTIEKAANSRWPKVARCDEIQTRLRDDDQDIRCQIALVLGEWGGETEAAALARLLREVENEEVQLAAITALRLLGGPAATRCLVWATEHLTARVSEAALTAIEELATGGRLEDAEPPGPLSRPLPADATGEQPVITRGPVRTRGALEATGVLHDEIAASLTRLTENQAASLYLRHRAGGLLRDVL